MGVREEVGELATSIRESGSLSEEAVAELVAGIRSTSLLCKTGATLDVEADEAEGTVEVCCEIVMPGDEAIDGVVVNPIEFLGSALGHDLDALALAGDTRLRDPLLRIHDGLFRQAQTHVVHAGGVCLGKQVLKAMVKCLPDEERQSLDGYRFITGFDAEDDYKGSLLAAQTTYGDTTPLPPGSPQKYFGLPLDPHPAVLEDYEGDTNEILLVRPENIHLRVGGPFALTKRTESGDDWFTLRCRVGSRFADETKVVRAHGLRLGMSEAA